MLQKFHCGSFPAVRMRRNRTSSAIGDLVCETRLNVTDLIYPMFVIDGNNKKQEIVSMPGTYRYSIDNLLRELDEVVALGIKAIALFPSTRVEDKSLLAEYAYADHGLIPASIRSIKRHFPELLVISDVALDPYTIHGQDGIIDEATNQVLNDATVEILVKQAICHARAGVDIVAPSDMMDGRIGAIRSALEDNCYHNTKILAYSAKYASSLYWPFRDAVGSASLEGAKKISKTTYQMDPANHREALREGLLDTLEGADLIMVKPAGWYLDVIHSLHHNTWLPIVAYQVSGEYTMMKAAFLNKWLDPKPTILESLLSIKRADARAIISYFAKEAALYLK